MAPQEHLQSISFSLRKAYVYASVSPDLELHTGIGPTKGKTEQRTEKYNLFNLTPQATNVNKTEQAGLGRQRGGPWELLPG